MNNDTKKTIKTWVINWIGVAIICFVSFYFTASATLKEHTEELRIKVDEKVYLEYMKQMDKQLAASIELIKAIQQGNIEQSERLWNEIDNIKTDIRTLYVNMGYKTRGTEKTTE